MGKRHCNDRTTTYAPGKLFFGGEKRISVITYSVIYGLHTTSTAAAATAVVSFALSCALRRMSSVGGSEEARTSHFGNATKPFDPSSLSALEGSETQSTTVTTTSVAAYHPSRLTTPQLGKKAYRAQLHSSRGGVMMARPCDSRWLLPRRTTTTTTLLHMMFSLVCTITLLKLRPCLAQATTSHHANGARHAKRSDYYPHVDHVEAIISTPWSFGGNQDVFTQASDWFADRLLDRGGDAKLAPYLACAKWGRGREAILAVKQVSTSPSTIHPISHTEAHGSCFIASLNPSIIEEGSLLQIPGVVSLWPFLPSLKLAPSLLDHGLGGVPEKGGTTVDELNLNFHDFAAPLLTVGGAAINIKNARGLSVRLAPGMLPIMTDVMTVSDYIREVRAGFMSESVNLEEMNYWSDPDVTHIDGRYAYLSREWRRAASFVHGLSSVNGVTPGDVCGLGKVSMHHIDDDLLAVEGMYVCMYARLDGFALRPATSSTIISLVVVVGGFLNRGIKIIWIRSVTITLTRSRSIEAQLVSLVVRAKFSHLPPVTIAEA